MTNNKIFIAPKDIKYSYRMQIICTQLYGSEYKWFIQKYSLSNDYIQNATSYFEHILEPTLQETTPVQPFTSYLANYSSKTNKEELISGIFLWTPIHKHTRCLQYRDLELS